MILDMCTIFKSELCSPYIRFILITYLDCLLLPIKQYKTLMLMIQIVYKYRNLFRNSVVINMIDILYVMIHVII